MDKRKRHKKKSDIVVGDVALHVLALTTPSLQKLRAYCATVEPEVAMATEMEHRTCDLALDLEKTFHLADPSEQSNNPACASAMELVVEHRAHDWITEKNLPSECRRLHRTPLPAVTKFARFWNVNREALMRNRGGCGSGATVNGSRA